MLWTYKILSEKPKQEHRKFVQCLFTIPFYKALNLEKSAKLKNILEHM